MRDADLACFNNSNCLDRFFWIRNGLCDVPVKGQSSNQVWICSGLFGPKGFKLPSEGKFFSKEKALIRFELSWNFWPKMVQVAPIKEKV